MLELERTFSVRLQRKQLHTLTDARAMLLEQAGSGGPPRPENIADTLLTRLSQRRSQAA